MLDDTPAIGLYKASWQNDTFRTDDASGAGYVAAGSAIVAGGKNVGLYAEGFTIGNVTSVTGDSIGNDALQLNSAFIDAGGATVARIVTGGGMDVVSDNGGKLTIEYDRIDASAQDPILGFDTGNDAIEFGGQAATLIDRDGCGMIEWQVASGPAFIVDAYTEGVEIESDGFLSNSTQDYALQSVADILNGAPT